MKTTMGLLKYIVWAESKPFPINTDLKRCTFYIVNCTCSYCKSVKKEIEDKPWLNKFISELFA